MTDYGVIQSLPYLDQVVQETPFLPYPLFNYYSMQVRCWTKV